MTTYNHTQIATGAAANASTINSPLGQLDASIGDKSSLSMTNLSIVSAIGTAALTTSVTNTLVGAINTLGDVSALGAGVNPNTATMVTFIGTAALRTTQQKVVPAINELLDDYTALDAEITAARDGYSDLDTRLDNMVLSGGNIATQADGAANAGQKIVDVDSTIGFVATAYVAYVTVTSGLVEYNQIDAVTSGTRLTLVNNIGAGGIANNTYITMISPSEYQAANVVPHGSADITLRDAIQAANQQRYNVLAYGATGDGVTDDTSAIQDAIDDAETAGGGVVYFAPGTYKVTDCVYLLDCHNVTLQGSGIDATIIDSSATVSLTNSESLTHYGTIAIDTTVDGTPVSHVHICDLTVKCSTHADVPAAQKGIFVGAVKDFVLERVHLDGSYQEGINHINTGTKCSENLTVRDCVVTNHVSNAIDMNNPELTGFSITGNAVYDGAGGILAHASQGVIANNVIRDVTNYAIQVVSEGAATYGGTIAITGNVMANVGYDADATVYVLSCHNRSDYDGGFVVTGNTIYMSQTAPSGVNTWSVYGMWLAGDVLCSNNVIRGQSGGNSVQCAIQQNVISGDTTAMATITGNRIEYGGASDDGWTYGIYCTDNAIVSDNYVAAGAIAAGGYAYRDNLSSGVVLHDNVFNADVIINGVTYNAGGEYDNRGMSVGRSQAYIGPTFRSTIDGWYQDNVSADQTAVALSRSAGAATDGWVATRSGNLTGIVVYSNAACAQGQLTAEVYKNGSGTGLTAVVTFDEEFEATTQASGTDSFVAGDVLDVRITTNNLWLPTTADVYAAIEIEL